MRTPQTFTEIADGSEEQEPPFADLVLALALHHGHTFFRRAELGQFFANSDELTDECIDAGWLRPAFSGNRLTGFNIVEIARCLQRLRVKGRPQHKQCSETSVGRARLPQEVA